MLFRDKITGDLVSINRKDFFSAKDYYNEIMRVFGIKPEIGSQTMTNEKISQVDFLYGIISRKRPSSNSS